MTPFFPLVLISYGKVYHKSQSETTRTVLSTRPAVRTDSIPQPPCGTIQASDLSAQGGGLTPRRPEAKAGPGQTSGCTSATTADISPKKSLSGMPAIKHPDKPKPLIFRAAASTRRRFPFSKSCGRDDFCACSQLSGIPGTVSLPSVSPGNLLPLRPGAFPSPPFFPFHLFPAGSRRQSRLLHKESAPRSAGRPPPGHRP